MEEKKPDETSVENTRHHSAHSRSSRSNSAPHKTSRRLALTIALSFSLLALFLLAIYSVVRINGLVRENEVLQDELTKARQELSQAGPELEQHRKTVSEMTKGRLPHLRDLEPDKVLQINDTYLKNIVFTVLNQDGIKSYEYRLVMENSTARTIHPEVRILVFDRYGVQIGNAEVAGRADMAPGESRSQSAVIDRFIDEEPHYFYVSKSLADKPAGFMP